MRQPRRSPTVKEYEEMDPLPGRIEGGLRTRAGLRKKSGPGMPLASIVTVVYNGADFLETTILSVLKQTYDNIEYIIIDGGSADGTIEIIKRYDDRIDYWLSEPDNGISDAFNKGIAASTGEVVGIINSDDWYEPDAVRRAMEHYPSADVIHGRLQYWEDGRKTYVFDASHDLLNREMTINHPTVFVKRGIYERFGAFKTSYRFAMDYDLLLRFYLAGVKFSYVNRILANMRMKGLTDDYWYMAYKESMDAKRENSGRRISPFFYFAWQLTRSYFSRSFDRIGLSAVKRIYRGRFAPVKKQGV